MRSSSDGYALRARYIPTALVVLPLVIAAVPWVPVDSAGWRLVMACVLSAPVIALLSHLGRDAGKHKQPDLFKAWDGPPSVRMLRHRDTTLPQETRARYKETLTKLIPGIELPGVRLERSQPEKADATYASCTDFLREHTRDKSVFKLVYEENVSYGFRRNLWAMKPAGVAVSLVAMAIAGCSVWSDANSGVPISAVSAAAFCTGSLMLVFWICRITRSWVKVAADAYAERLLGACELLASQHAAK